METRESRISVYDSDLDLRFVKTGWKGWEQKQEPARSLFNALRKQYPDGGELTEYVMCFPNDSRLYAATGRFATGDLALADLVQAARDGPTKFSGDLFMMREFLEKR